jgi:dolichol-phosphate mannosyltransferase
MTSILARIDPAWLGQVRITIVIPTYNEADNLPAITEALLALPLPGLQVLVVDDNSPDSTGDIADALAARFNPEGTARPRMVVIHRQGKGGLGTAYVAGMRRALDDGADFVVQMDADFSHSPAYIPQMLGVILSAEADVIIGSRYVPGGSLDAGWGWWRRLLSWWANLYSRMILGLRIRDMTAGFKLWRRAALQQIDLEQVRSNGYSFQVEMAYLSERLNYHIIELPIHFADRRIGQSKLDVPVKLESAWRTWQIRWRYRNLRRPDPTLAPTVELNTHTCPPNQTAPSVSPRERATR